MDKEIKQPITTSVPVSGLGGVSIKSTPESKGLRIVEKLLAALLLVLVIWGMGILILSIPWIIIPENMITFHKVLEQVLSDVLLLVVTLELAIMLVYRKIEYLLDIMLFVIARKMLIGATASLDIAIGVAALAALFAVRKYLLLCPGCTITTSMADSKNVVR
ncbi:MAG: hypothetical protein ACE5EN_09845 [Nitrospinota bacterium]